MMAPGNQTFFGWKVVWAAFTITFLSAGTHLYGLPVFMHVLNVQRGWPISVVSSAITAHFLVSALAVACLKETYDRFGMATVTRAGAIATALGMLCWGVAVSPWHLFGAAILTGVGWATASAAAINAMVAPWFKRRRPVALGHALNGMSVAGIVFVPLWTVVIDRVGLPAAAIAGGVMALVVIWPLAGHYLRPTPATAGLAPDGDPVPVTINTPSAASPVPLRSVVANRGFLTLSAAFALGMFAQVGLLAHLFARLVPTFGSDGAAMAVSLTAACAIVGRSLLAACLGSLDRRIAAAANFVVQACGVTLLAFGSNGATTLAGAVLFGLGIGNLLLLPPLIAQSEYGEAEVPRVVGLVVAVNIATFAFGPACLGVVRDLSGTYTVAFLLAAVAQVTAAIAILVGHRSVVAKRFA